MGRVLFSISFLLSIHHVTKGGSMTYLLGAAEEVYLQPQQVALDDTYLLE